MSILLFANNASTTLASPITNTATSCSLAAGTGSLFPVVTAGTYFELTFQDAATGLVNEIAYVTARTGDVCTITRGQEGTTAVAWLAGDLAQNFWTAGSARAMIQVAQLQVQATNIANDTGSTNNVVVSYTPAPVSLASIHGSPMRVAIAHANTGAMTININGLGATQIINTDSSAIEPGQLFAGTLATFMFDGANFQLVSPTSYQLLDRASAWLAQQTYVAAPILNNGVPLVGKDTGGTQHPLILQATNDLTQIWGGPNGLQFVDNTGGVQTAVITNAGLFSALGLTVSGNANIGGSTTSLIFEATFGATGSGDPHRVTSLSDFNASIAGNGFQALPSGMIFQWSFIPNIPVDGITRLYNLPIAFPNSFHQIVGCFGALAVLTGSTLGMQPFSNSQFNAVAYNATVGGSLGAGFWAIGF